MIFDVKLRELIGKIEHSHLSQSEKNDVYASIHAGLRTAVWPVLVAHMPKEDLDKIAVNSEGVTPDAYASLIKNAIKDENMFEDLEGLMISTLIGVENVLKDKLIIQA